MLQDLGGEIAVRWLADRLESGVVPADLVAMVELAAAEGAEPATLSVHLRALRERRFDVLGPAERWQVARAIWRLADAPWQPERMRQEAAIDMLAEAAAIGQHAWRDLLSSGELDRVMDAELPPVVRLAALEHLLDAPADSGLPRRATAELEALGHANPSDAGLIRAIERLLHTAGEREGAYRMEALHRATRRSPLRQPALPSRFAGLSIAIAGGHPALRARIRADLVRSGVADVRDVPSAQEASRSGRDIADTLRSTALVVMLVGQMAHSTSDQVRAVATREGIPVVKVDSSSVLAVRRVIEAVLQSTDG